MKTLWAHQQDAFRYTGQVQHPALFMEMRLGKTLPTIMRIAKYRPQGDHLRVLVVGPNCVLQGWADEITEAQGGEVVFLNQGSKAMRREAMLEAWKKEQPVWCLMNKEGHRLLPETSHLRWDAVVLDESPFIRNPKTQVSRFYVKGFRHVPHRFALSGTPNPESDLDYVQQLLWLNSGIGTCHSFWDFRALHCIPDGYTWVLSQTGREILRRELALRSFFLRRKDVKITLPFVKEVRTLELPPQIRRKYDKAETQFILEGGDTDWETTLAVVRYTWLKKICNGIVEDDLLWDGKYEAVMEILLGELKNERVLLWFSSNTALHEMSRWCSVNHVWHSSITGKTTPKERTRLVAESKQNPGPRCLLMQVACGEFGLDLSHFSAVIYFDLPTSAQSYRQSFERTLNLRKKETTLYLYFFTKNTVDEDTYLALAQKNMNAMRLADQIKAIEERRLSHGE